MSFWFVRPGGRSSWWARYAVRLAIVAGLIAVYLWSFFRIHEAVGGLAFLLGMFICAVGGALLGMKGAVVVVAVMILVDRSLVLTMRADQVDPQSVGKSSRTIGVLAKLLVGLGTGFVFDSRRRMREVNARLAAEVAARQSGEASLERSERLYRVLVESLGEGVGLFDSEDRFRFANRALATTLGTTPEALQDRRFRDFFAEAGHGRAGGSSESDSLPRSYELVLKGSESTLLLVTETRLAPGASQEVLTLRVLRDLSERIVSERRQRDLEKELQRSEALQSLAVLAGGVAHDFNNLLSGVLGNAELAQRWLPTSAPPDLGSCLEEIKTFAGEAAQLSRQMLAYAGRRSLAVEPTDVNTEVLQALRLLHGAIEARARLVTELAEALPQVAADRFQLRQVLSNLAINGLEAMGDQRGTLTLRTQRVSLTRDQLADGKERPGLLPGEYVCISVQDTGRGVPAALCERIFEPFFSTKGTGRGMGLAAVEGIVRAHRGLLKLDRSLPTGTAFHVLLPVARAGALREVRRGSRPALQCLPQRILLIDDEAAVRLVTGRLLTELGQQVLTAESGAMGLEVFAQQGPSIDLVLLDLTMPDLMGSEVLGELVRQRSDVRVVISSGFHPDDASSLLSDPNVVGFLEKPHTLANLEMLLAAKH